MPQLNTGFAFVSGGGLRMGQVVGASDRRGENPVGRPFRTQNVLATLYNVLGIDPATTFPDHNTTGRSFCSDPSVHRRADLRFAFREHRDREGAEHKKRSLSVVALMFSNYAKRRRGSCP